MPKDAWKKANYRAKYGPVGGSKTQPPDPLQVKYLAERKRMKAERNRQRKLRRKARKEAEQQEG